MDNNSVYAGGHERSHQPENWRQAKYVREYRTALQGAVVGQYGLAAELTKINAFTRETVRAICEMERSTNNWINPLSDWSTDPEETANTVTHGLGLLLSLLGAIVLAISVLRVGDTWRVLGCMIYTTFLVAVYAMSTLSHICLAPKLKRIFQILDQGFIYLLIVATYTPFSLAFLRSSFWWLFLAVLWTIAISGFLSKILLAHRVDAVAIWIYVVLGWMPIVAAPFLVDSLPVAGLWWMLIGGLCYTVGTVFLIFDNHIRHFHALWHLLVIAGSACHFFVILLFVAPVR